jgi:Zn finger protein HypA/HybF involved in hydrogenase expression
VHEFAVTEGLLEIVQTEARKAGAESVDEVHVTIGELSTFVDRSIEFYFSELSRGTSNSAPKALSSVARSAVTRYSRSRRVRSSTSTASR